MTPHQEDFNIKLRETLAQFRCRQNLYKLFEYSVDDDKKTYIKKYVGNCAHAVIPHKWASNDYVKYIGKHMFEDSKATAVTVCDGVAAISSRAFIKANYLSNVKSIREIWLPDTIKSIGSIDHDKVQYFMVNGYVRYVDQGKAVLPWPANAVIHTSKDTYVECYANAHQTACITCQDGVLCEGKTRIVLPECITEISSEDFRECEAIESVVIPKSVTVINGGAFRGCKSLTSIFIPDSVEKIRTLKLAETKYEAFGFCPKLTIYATPGSVAWRYAEEHDIKHEPMPENMGN